MWKLIFLSHFSRPKDKKSNKLKITFRKTEVAGEEAGNNLNGLHVVQLHLEEEVVEENPGGNVEVHAEVDGEKDPFLLETSL